ncbi:MAG: invasin domain 3-containing protein, partial [Gemmatimonadota bacterium]
MSARLPLRPRLPRWLRFAALSILGPAVTFGCETITIVAVEVASVLVSPGQLTLPVGQSFQLSVLLRGPNGVTLSGRSVTWISDDPNRASVDQDGMVTAESPGPVTIRATADGVAGTASITVSPLATIVLSRSDITFATVIGGGPTASEIVQVTNGGQGILSGLELEIAYQAGSAEQWLEAILAGASAPTNLNLRALPAGVPAGTHRATVEVRSAVSGNSPQTIQVTLEVGAQPPGIQLDRFFVRFESDAGEVAPAPEAVQVTNSGNGVLSGIATEISYEVGQPTDWLQASVNPPTAPTQIILTADPAALVPGTFDAVVRVTAASAPGASTTIAVRFVFGNPPAEIELGQTELAVQLLEASSPPPSTTITIENRGAGTIGNLARTITYGAGEPDGWLQAGLGGSIAPTSISLTVNPTNPALLPPGVYHAEVAITSLDAANSPQIIAVVLTVLPRPDLTLSIIAANPTAILADGTSTSSILVTLVDPRGDPISTGGHPVTIATNLGAIGPVTDNGDGTYGATLTSSTVVGSPVIVASVFGDVLFSNPQVQFVAGPPTHIELTGPVSVTAGAPSAVFTLRTLDAFGNEASVPDATQFTLTSGSTGTVVFDPVSPVTIPGGASRVTFTYSDTESGEKVVTAAWLSGGADLGSDTHLITVDPAAANAIRIVTQPAAGVSGDPLAVQPSVEVIDQFLNRVTGDNTTQVMVGILSGADGMLGGTLTATATAGLANFAGVTFSGTLGVNYVFRFTSLPDLGNADSGNVAIAGAGSPAKLAIVTQPSGSAQSGIAFAGQPAVRLLDASNNPVAQPGVTVTVSLASGAVTLGPAPSLTATTNGAGVATFGGLTITGAVGVRTLRFEATGLTEVVSSAINVGPGTPVSLRIVTQPVAGASGALLTTQPSVEILDGALNRVTTNNSVAVSVAIQSGAGATLGGTLQATASSGLATFSGATFAGLVGTNYVLRFTSVPALGFADSNNVMVTGPGTAASLRIVTQPAAGTSGALLTTQPTVEILDGAMNRVTTNNSTVVSVAVLPAPAGGSVGGTLSATASSGLATFSGVTFAGLVGTNYVLRFTSVPALGNADSNDVTVTGHGVAASLRIVAQPVAGASGSLLTTQPAVEILDGAMNRVTSDNTTVISAAIFSGTGGSLGPVANPTATVSVGVATFSAVTFSGLIGTPYVLRFTPNIMLGPVNSTNVAVTGHGAAAALRIVTPQPVAGASGALMTTQPRVEILDGAMNRVTSDNMTQVTVAVLPAPAGGSVGGTLSATASAGLATFSGVTFAGLVGTNYVLRFTSVPALTAVNSNDVMVSGPGAPASLNIVTPPVGGASGGVLATQPEIEIRDGASNRVTTDNSTVVTVAIFSGTGGTLGPVPTPTATASMGLASFAGVTLTGTVGEPYVLRFSSGALPPVNAAPVTVTAGGAVSLRIVEQPVAGAS